MQLNIPLDGPRPRWTERGLEEIAAPSFERVGDRPLVSILSGASRRSFVAPLTRGREADRQFRCAAAERSKWGVVALRELEAAGRRLEGALAAHPFPAACRGCAKASGW